MSFIPSDEQYPSLYTNVAELLLRPVANTRTLEARVRVLASISRVPALLAADPEAAVLLDAALCGPGDIAVLAAALATTPRLRLAAYVPDDARASVAAGVRLHNIGVRPLIDGTSNGRWAQMRTFVAREIVPVTHSFAEVVRDRYKGYGDVVRTTIDAIVSMSEPLRGVSALAEYTNTAKNTVVSAFHRPGLTSPDVLLRNWWLLEARRAAAEQPTATVGALAESVGYGSSQTFARMIEKTFRCTTVQWIASHPLLDVEEWFLGFCPSGSQSPRVLTVPFMTAKGARGATRGREQQQHVA
jgi:AraC-like DNA-binding protein